MTFFGNIVYLRPRSATCGPRARAANDTTRAQINNISEKNHVIPLFYERAMVANEVRRAELALESSQIQQARVE